MNRPVIAVMAIAGLAACQPASPVASAGSMAAAEHESVAFAEAACGGCHAITAHGLSPNPQAPEWPVIANREGLTAATLATWLRDAHNYPEQMDFYLDDDEVDQLVAYMLSLKHEGYEPPIQ